MANQQGGSMGGQAGTRGSSPDQPTGRHTQSTGQTGVRDATYNLISVVYHALQGAETYKMYEEDVERTQDAELAQFFRQAHEEEKRRAQQGKELLQRQLQRQGSGGGGQQLQGGSSSQQGGGSRGGQQSQSDSTQQSAGSSDPKTQAVPAGNYGNTQSSSTRSGQQSQSGSSSGAGQMGGTGSRSKSSDGSQR